MMNSSSEERYKPKFTEDAKTGKQKLKNNVVRYVGAFTFYKSEEEECNLVLGTLTTVLWLLDGHHLKLETAPGVPSLPLPFQQNKPFKTIYHQGEKKKVFQI